MARITVPFLGITSQPNHKDGECSNIVNLRPKNGYLKPVPPRKTIAELNKLYNIVFVHKVGTLEKWIGVAGTVIYSDITGTAKFLKEVGESINSVQQIGNTLSFVTDTTIYYVLWQNEQYKFLGKIPELPVVSFETVEIFEDKKKFVDEFGDGIIGGIDDIDGKLDPTKGLMNIIISENNTRFYDSFFISYALRLYDGSIVKSSSPILVMPQDQYSMWGVAYLPKGNDPRRFEFTKDSDLRIKFYKLKASYDFSSLGGWSDIITSVDFFATNYTGIGSPENIYPHFNQRMISNGRDHPLTDLYSLFQTSISRPSQKIEWQNDIVEKTLNTSQFYLYLSIDDFTTQKSIVLPNKDATVFEDFSNIIHQEDMPSDSFSHHKIGAKNATVYNERLRLSGVTTSLYTGHPVSQFRWSSKYNGVDTSEGVVATDYITTRVTIKTEQGEFILGSNGDNGQVLFNNAFISYPDPRATRIRIYTVETTGYIHERLDIKLVPHPRLNIAYALNGNLKPYTPVIDNLSGGTPHYDTYARLFEPNKLKVSEVNNPFMFPSQNTYQIGSGEILAESSIAMNVTDRNYGMFPVFVFTTAGVFTMAGQSADTVHDSIQAPTYLEPPISKVIGATPYGVCFATKSGLMLISQHETVPISPQLREDDNNVILHQKNMIPGSNINYPTSSFTDFLQHISEMVYNPYNKELIISSSNYDYSYVYDFASKSFYLSTEKFTSTVQNVYPELYVVDGLLVKDYSKRESNTANVSIITRPLYFGTEDIKTLSRVLLRGILYNTQVMSNVAFHALDGINFYPIKGVTYGSIDGRNNYIDYDMGLLSRETYNQYLFLLTGTIDADSQIRYIDYMVEKRYNNDKMR